MPFGIFGSIKEDPKYKKTLIPANSEILKNHIQKVTNGMGPRNFSNIPELNRVADYIYEHFEQIGLKPQFQKFNVTGESFKNVIAIIGKNHNKKIVIGAHYDVYGEHKGADDNASGVAGLLELGRILKTIEVTLLYQVELVAYTLEEPPFFRTEQMGSFIHAKSLSDNNEKILGMFSLEMIGYFTDEKNSQHYPLGLMKWFYPDVGNFIAVVSNFGSNSLLKKLKLTYLKTTKLPCEKLAAPSFVQGVDFSDHFNYWKFGYKAAMVTDTAFMRNKNYHTSEDTIDKLDFKRMATVIDGLANFIYSGLL